MRSWSCDQTSNLRKLVLEVGTHWFERAHWTAQAIPIGCRRSSIRPSHPNRSGWGPWGLAPRCGSLPEDPRLSDGAICSRWNAFIALKQACYGWLDHFFLKNVEWFKGQIVSRTSVPTTFTVHQKASIPSLLSWMRLHEIEEWSSGCAKLVWGNIRPQLYC